MAIDYSYKAKTTAKQVAIRDGTTTSATVLMRVDSGSEIEVRDANPGNDGKLWRAVAYGYQKHGYMMNDYISLIDSTSNKYFMIQTLETFGDKLYVRGNSDLHSDYGEIHNIQVTLNALYNKYTSHDPSRPLKKVTVDGIFGSGTEEAVKNAQAFMGCGVDGKVGPQTKARLYYSAYGKGGWPLAENAG